MLSTDVNEDEQAARRERIARLRSKAMILAQAVDRFRGENPLQAAIWERRLKNVAKKLAKEFFAYVTGCDLDNPDIGPADEPPERWNYPES